MGWTKTGRLQRTAHRLLRPTTRAAETVNPADLTDLGNSQISVTVPT